ncbi:MAG: NAD(P)H-hydrate dehydratase [Bacillota bacterium]|nr:NAD(P)H-hydrate dehydratase [Bacillota bacterium]
MQYIVMPDQMRLIEKQAFDQGVPSLLLMENAARAVFDAFQKREGDVRGKSALFLIGGGNNGGDGLALARLFALSGGDARLILTREPKTPDARANFAYAKALGIPYIHWTERSHPERLLPRTDYIFDAVFGLGFRGELPLLAARLFKAIKEWDTPVYALDVPSGFDSLTGELAPGTLPALVTYTLGHLKIGQCLTRLPAVLGEVEVLPIGLPEDAYLSPTLSSLITTLEPADLPSRLPKRASDAHKGDAGRVLMYMGSMGMAGAAGFAAQAALACLRSGAGLVTVVCEMEVIPIVQTLAPNATCLPISKALKSRPSYDVFAVGPGLSQSDTIFDNILKLWNPDKPSVWDADALNMLAERPMNLGSSAVLTPHPGEAARLLGMSAPDITFDPLGAGFELQRRYGGTVVLKDAHTLIRDASRTAVNLVGSPALAKGGSGDALAGIIAALLAQTRGEDPFESACTGCLWHGLAGRRAEQKLGTLSPLTDDVIACLGEVALEPEG